MEAKGANHSLHGLAFAAGSFLSLQFVIPVFCIRMLGMDPQTGSIVRLGLTFCLLAFAFLVWFNRSDYCDAAILNSISIRWVLVFILFSGCSLLWTEASSSVASATYWCGTVADVSLVVLLLLMGPGPVVASSLMEGFVWSTCLIGVIAWVMPVQYDLRLGDEDYFNANTIGNLCAFAIFFAQCLSRRRRGRWWVRIGFLVITLIRTLSKSTIAAFVISECFLLIHDKQMSKRAKSLVVLSAIFLVIVFWGLFGAYYDFYTTYGNEAETLTGRTAIWAYVLDEGLQRPWIGHGFDSMWNVIPAFGTFEARHAENELLEQFYSYGVAGIAILCGVYGAFYLEIRKLSRSSLRVILLSVMVFALVRGVAEADPFDLLLPLWMIVLFSVMVKDAQSGRMTHASSAARGLHREQQGCDPDPTACANPIP